MLTTDFTPNFEVQLTPEAFAIYKNKDFFQQEIGKLVVSDFEADEATHTIRCLLENANYKLGYTANDLSIPYNLFENKVVKYINTKCLFVELSVDDAYDISDPVILKDATVLWGRIVIKKQELNGGSFIVNDITNYSNGAITASIDSWGLNDPTKYIKSFESNCIGNFECPYYIKNIKISGNPYNGTRVFLPFQSPDGNENTTFEVDKIDIETVNSINLSYCNVKSFTFGSIDPNITAFQFSLRHSHLVQAEFEAYIDAIIAAPAITYGEIYLYYTNNTLPADRKAALEAKGINIYITQ